MINNAKNNENYLINSIIEELKDININKAPLASPALTGTPTAPTATTGTNTTQLATVAYANAIAGGTTAPAKSLASNGYVKMANGLIIQWGKVDYVPGNGSTPITFPVAFPNACLEVISGGWYGSLVSMYSAYVGGTPSTTGCTAYNANGGAVGLRWIAIGY